MEPTNEPDHYPAYLSTDADRPLEVHELSLLHEWLAESIGYAQRQEHRRRLLLDAPDLLAAHDVGQANLLEGDYGTALRLCQRLANELSRHLAPEPAAPWLDSPAQQYWLAQQLGLPAAQDLLGRVLDYKAQARFFPPGQLQLRGLDHAAHLLHQLDACQQIARQFERQCHAPDQLSLTLGGLYVQVAQLAAEYEKRSPPLGDALPKPTDPDLPRPVFDPSARAALHHEQQRAGQALDFTWATTSPTPTPDA